MFYRNKTHQWPPDRHEKEREKNPVGQEAAINLVNQGIVSGCKENPKQSQPPIIQPSRPIPAPICTLAFRSAFCRSSQNIGFLASASGQLPIVRAETTRSHTQIHRDFKVELKFDQGLGSIKTVGTFPTSEWFALDNTNTKFIGFNYHGS